MSPAVPSRLKSGSGVTAMFSPLPTNPTKARSRAQPRFNSLSGRTPPPTSPAFSCPQKRTASLPGSFRIQPRARKPSRIGSTPRSAALRCGTATTTPTTVLMQGTDLSWTELLTAQDSRWSIMEWSSMRPFGERNSTPPPGPPLEVQTTILSSLPTSLGIPATTPGPKPGRFILIPPPSLGLPPTTAVTSISPTAGPPAGISPGHPVAPWNVSWIWPRSLVPSPPRFTSPWELGGAVMAPRWLLRHRWLGMRTTTSRSRNSNL